MRTISTEMPRCEFPSESSEMDPAQVMDIVDSFDSRQLFQYSSFHPKNLRHYAETQKQWLQDSTYFLGIDLGHRPSPGELADKILGTNHSQRFRAYYALSFPNLVVIDEEALKQYDETQIRLLIDR